MGAARYLFPLDRSTAEGFRCNLAASFELVAPFAR